jgi:hypothetical protein
MADLGDEVEDTVSGYRGIVFAKHVFLFGSVTLSVQPQIDRYGVLPDAENFYESQLKVIKKGKQPERENTLIHKGNFTVKK